MGYAGEEPLGVSVKASQPLRLSPEGSGDASLSFQPIAGWAETMASQEMTACIAA